MGLTNLIIGALLLLAGAFLPERHLLAGAGAALILLPLADLVFLVDYVFSEDSYRGGGISRWDAYTTGSTASASLFVISAVVLVAGSALIAAAVFKRQTRRIRVATIATGLACIFLVTATVIAFAVN